MKLEWQDNPPEYLMTWHEAIDYSYSLRDGWRLPTRGELCDAYDNNIKGFIKDYYWSSSMYAWDTTNAWGVGFGDGHVYGNDKTYKYNVRCVREIG